MNPDTFFIYTDASYSKAYGIAVIGFAQFTGVDHHKLTALSELELHIEMISEKNNIRSELRSAIMGLKSCPKNSKVMLYSDCHAVTQLPQRRENLEKQKFISKSTGLTLPNADLYKEFYSISDQVDIEIQWIKGHSANRYSDTIQTNFSYLDKQVRKKLRVKILEIKDKQ